MLDDYCKAIRNKKYHMLIIFFIGIIIHAQMLFQCLARHDEIKLLSGMPFEMGILHGRWLVTLMTWILDCIFGKESITGLYGIVVIAIITFISIFIVQMYSLEKVWELYIIAGIMLVIPVVSSNLGYLVAAPFNFLGIFLCFLASGYITHTKNLKNFIIATCLFAISLGEYQWHFALYASAIVFMEFFIIVKKDDSYQWRRFFADGFYYIASLVVGLVLYIAITEFTVRFTGISLSAYAGTSSYGVVPIAEYFARVKLAYLNFLNLHSRYIYSIFSFQHKEWYYAFIFFVGGCCLYQIILQIRNGKQRNGMQLFIISLIMPLVTNFMFVLYLDTYVHALHMYQYILYFVLIIKILCNDNMKYCLKLVGALFCLSFFILWWRYDNLCYMREEIISQRTLSYSTRLISCIESIDGYNPDIPVYFYFTRKSIDPLYTMPYCVGDEEIVTPPYVISEINEFSFLKFMEVYCGYKPRRIYSIKGYEELLNSMNIYPSKGSIVLVDGILIVKL